MLLRWSRRGGPAAPRDAVVVRSRTVLLAACALNVTHTAILSLFASTSMGAGCTALVAPSILLWAVLWRWRFDWARWCIVILSVPGMAASVLGALIMTGLVGQDLTETITVLCLSGVFLVWGVLPPALLVFSDAARDYTSGATSESVRAQWEEALERAKTLAVSERRQQTGAPRSAPARLVAAAALRRRWSQVSSAVAFGSLAIVAAAAAARVGYAMYQLLVVSPETLRRAAEAQASYSPTFWVPLNLVGAYIAFFVLPSTAALVVLGPLALLWRRPARILLLRPFHRGREGRSLRRIVRGVVAPFGHVYSLADADVRIPFWVRFPLVGGQLSLFHFRRRRILHVRHLDALRKAMMKTRRRNVNWCVSPGKIFAVAVADVGWRATVLTLFREADLILFDLSVLSPNLRWELDGCVAAGGLGRTMFLAGSATASDADRALADLSALAGLRVPVWRYGAGGVCDQEAFTTALAAILSVD